MPSTNCRELKDLIPFVPKMRPTCDFCIPTANFITAFKVEIRAKKTPNQCNRLAITHKRVIRKHPVPSALASTFCSKSTEMALETEKLNS